MVGIGPSMARLPRSLRPPRSRSGDAGFCAFGRGRAGAAAHAVRQGRASAPEQSAEQLEGAAAGDRGEPRGAWFGAERRRGDAAGDVRGNGRVRHAAGRAGGGGRSRRTARQGLPQLLRGPAQGRHERVGGGVAVSCKAGMVDYKPFYDDGEQKALAIIQVFEDAAAPFGAADRLRGGAAEAPALQPGDDGRPAAATIGSCPTACSGWLATSTAATPGARHDLRLHRGEPATSACSARRRCRRRRTLRPRPHRRRRQHHVPVRDASGRRCGRTPARPTIAATGAIGCEYVHVSSASERVGTEQVAELMAFFGPNSPDDVAPVVKLLSPAGRSAVQRGSAPT